MDQLAMLDGLGQAELVRTGQVSPAELVAAAIDRIERINPQLNAVVLPLYEQARVAATAVPPDGPFRGVPTLLKDLGTACAGVPLTDGSAFTRCYVPPYDSLLVTRMRRAGLVVVGKSSTPEFGLLPTTEPALFGPCRNPWAPDLTPGGSSGGAAAAVAAGLVPVAHASDGGGSIRIPAACCGLVGLKPSRGRVSMAPLGDLTGLSVWHAITRSVRDSAAFLDLAAGPVPGDPYYVTPPIRPFLTEVTADPGPLRIALSTTALNGTPVHPDSVAAAEDAAALCRSLGHEVTLAAPPISGEQFQGAFLTLWAALLAASIDMMAPLAGQPPSPDQFEPTTWALAEQGWRQRPTQYLQAVAAIQGISRQVAAWHQPFDLWLTPTLAEPPLPLGSLAPEPGNPLRAVERATAFCPFTPLANATGQPAISLPLHWNGQGLPIGVQFAARWGDEATLLRLAGQLEAARPWAGRRPPIHA